jgi:dolichol-phosphate mannosyltransferase
LQPGRVRAWDTLSTLHLRAPVAARAVELLRRNAAKFAAIGASGIVVNQIAIWLFTDELGIHYLVSAILASQISTTWNFVLVERLVFPGRHGGRHLVWRYAKFWAVNMSTFLFRGPALVIAVDMLGMHYLVANLALLLMLFVVRYMISDRWIWRRPVATTLVRAAADLDDEVAP